MTETTIEWTQTIGPDGRVRPGKTWNPFRARNIETGNEGTYCEQVSPGCANCYAETLNEARRWDKGTGLPYAHSARGKVEHFINWSMVQQALGWQHCKVFVDSMSDLFGEWMRDEDIDIVVFVAWRNPTIILQLLTKRAERMASYFAGWGELEPYDRRRRMQRAHVRVMANVMKFPSRKVPAYDGSWPMPNLWLGITAEDQQRADERLRYLLTILARVRWVSYEPAIGPVDFEAWGWGGIDWVIVGGETGTLDKIREFDLEWARDVIRQGKAASFRVFVKQMGQKAFVFTRDNGLAAPEHVRREYHATDTPGLLRCDYRFTGHGRDMGEWPADLRVREFPDVGAQ